ncbi:hypothetical protein PR003_g27074 [Phytophthora rubi]|uniref:Protein kinase domain-containing protein n=1 Tax=Phytophthora rubi TaxID=129364 RepID=A0A6A4C375_9STRA|nr:hypothetical protein PR003_g27074 [Phytophthora rubi]
MDDDQAKTSFFKEVELWRRLNNPHVVELFCASHVSPPAFFVCVDAIHSNFADHFMEGKCGVAGLAKSARSLVRLTNCARTPTNGGGTPICRDVC